MTKKVLYVATVASHICQFHLPYLETLQSKGIIVHVAARDNLAEKNGLQLKFTDEYYDIPFERSPMNKRNVIAYKNLKKIISQNDYDLIVCNTPVGGIITRLAARNSRKKGTKVVYIAHGFHFYKGASKKKWAVFYPIEKIFARFCDIVITINEEDFKLAKNRFKTDVRHIHGIGVDEKRYHCVSEDDKKSLRNAIDLNNEDFVILCTGELNQNKNQTQLIKAAANLIDKIPNLKILLAGNGPKQRELLSEIEKFGLGDTVKLLGYRTDIENIVPVVDLVVSCSRREGMPLNIIEAMLCKKPIVATYNRGHNELIKDGVNGYLVSPDKPEDLAERIHKIYSDSERARSFALSSEQIAQNYTVAYVKKELSDLLLGNL